VNLQLPANRVAVKICGVTHRDDAMAAIEAGADLLGFNTWKGTRRFIDLEKNAAWISSLPRHACRVALLVNAPRSEAGEVAALPYIDALQFHGDEDAAYCAWAAGLGKPIIKAIRARDAGVLDAADLFATPHILLDAHVQGKFGGTGARVDVALARRFKAEHPKLTIWLAGGLTPANVADAVQVVQPRVVDVSSGVESAPGRKDVGRMRAFVLAANTA
jgi:phosphoribosylanthranilate isomerase